MTVDELVKAIEQEQKKARSAWRKGVCTYALMLIDLADDLENAISDNSVNIMRKSLLNGATDFKEYSYGGCAFVENEMIARTLCNNTEYKRTNGGDKNPNSRENWLDVQARALGQACYLILLILFEK